MKSQQQYLQDILQRIERIERYVAQGKTVFLQDGVIRSFEVIGEAIKRLSDDLKMQQPQVEWRGMAWFCRFSRCLDSSIRQNRHATSLGND